MVAGGNVRGRGEEEQGGAWPRVPQVGQVDRKLNQSALEIQKNKNNMMQKFRLWARRVNLISC